MSEPTPQAQIDAANAYEPLMVPALFGEWASRVADAAQIRPAQRVLDVACGTGVLGREVAARGGPTGIVVGLDPAPGMLEVALLGRVAGERAADALRAPFVLGDRDDLAALFEDAGIASIEVTTEHGTARFPSVRVMVEADLRGWLPVMGVVLPEEQIARIIDEAEDVLGLHVTTGGPSYSTPRRISSRGPGHSVSRVRMPSTTPMKLTVALGARRVSAWRWTVTSATLIAIGAALRYPGGTALDPTTKGYSLSRNFLSDLGMTVAYSHEPNRLGAALFVASLLLLVIGLGSVVGVLARSLAVDAGSRRWARLAAVALLAVCVAFTGVAVTPENRLMSLHVGFTEWAWRTVPAVTLFLGLASRHNARLRKPSVLAWFGATVLLGAYAALLSWGPGVAAPDGLVVQVIAQKVATVVLLVTLLIALSEMERVNREESTTAAGSVARAG